MTARRSFERDVLAPLGALGGEVVRSAGEVVYDGRSYPLLYVQLEGASVDVPRVLVSGGVHGEEPAGVYASVRFALDVARAYADRYSFLVFPCVNPSGFEANRSENGSGINVNRSFGTPDGAEESGMIEKLLAELRPTFRFTMDLHEIDPTWSDEGFRPEDNPRSCYLYESAKDGVRRIGREMIAALPASVEVCGWTSIYGDVNEGGVISYPVGNRNPVYAQGTTFDGYLFGRYTDHSFTTETPIGWNMEKRVQTHLSFLETALRST